MEPNSTLALGPGDLSRISHPATISMAFTMLAFVAPTLLALNFSPSATFLNQALAYLGFGIWCARLAGLTRLADVRDRGTRASGMAALIGVAGLLGLSAAIAPPWAGLPWAMAWAALCAACSAAVVAWAGWRGVAVLGREPLVLAASALLLSGLLGCAIGLVQVFKPGWCDGNFIAATTLTGRAVGNLRQPNHLATLMLWACAAAAWLGSRGGLNRLLAGAAIALLVFGVVLTASRTGMVGVALLTVWGLLDARMHKGMRRMLWAAPLIYVLGWIFMHWLSLHGQAFGAEARLHDGSDISSSRFAIWANTLDLIRAHPWTGVGWGEFNFAWTLTPFPNRPIAFFDHTHNLLLQFAVELGLPLTALIVLLLGYAGWRLLMAALGPEYDDAQPPEEPGLVGAPEARMALYMVVLAMIHSQLEYPLWYAYFLLPTAFFWGAGLAAERRKLPTEAPRAQEPGWVPRLLLLGSAAMVIGSVAAVLDYLTVVQIFQPSANAGPLEERIARGQRSVLFGYQADYALATTEEDEPSAELAAFKRPLHNLIDSRLMISFARSLADRGEVDKARFIVARLREFQRLYPDKGAFLNECKKVAPDEVPPFQCDVSPTQTKSYLDFRDMR